MASFCPNINSKEWKDHEKLVGPKMSYYMWMANGGFPLNLAPNGKESNLIKSLMELPEVTSIQQAMVIKSRMLTSGFKQWQETTPAEGFKPEGKLLSFLEEYGFDISDAESLSINLALKEISLDSNDPEQVAKAVAAPLAEMLSYSDYFYEIERDVRKSKRFKRRLSELKKEYPESTRRNLNRIVTKEIFKELLESGFSEQLSEELNIKKSFIDKIKEIIQKIAQAFSGTNFKASREQVSKIVENTFKGDDFIRLTKKEGYKQVKFQEAFDENDIAKDIMTKIGTNENIVLTGSIAYSTQGTVYRKIETVVHDLDFVNQGLSKEEIDELVKSNYPDAILAYSFTDKYDVDTYLVPPVGITIENIQRRDTGKITYYELHNSKGEVVGTYELQFEVSGTNKTINETEFKTGKEAMLVDFFTNDEDSREIISQEFKGSDNKSHTVKLSKFDAPFEAKLRFSRFKDIWDYNRFIPKVLDENREPVIQNGNVINKSGETLPIFSESTKYYLSKKNNPDNNKKDKVYLRENLKIERPADKRNEPLTAQEVLNYFRNQGWIHKWKNVWKITKGVSGFDKGKGYMGNFNIVLEKLRPYKEIGLIHINSKGHVYINEQYLNTVDTTKTRSSRAFGRWWSGLSLEEQRVENARRVQEGLQELPTREDEDYMEFSIQGGVDKESKNYKELESRLLRFAEANGIGVEKVESITEELKARGKLVTTTGDIVGVAMIMEKLIMLADGKSDTRDLAEEVAHFVVEWMWNDISTQRAIQEIEQTQEYTEVVNEYSGITTVDSSGRTVPMYNATRLQKEALAKMIASSIVNQEVSESAKPKVPLLKAIWSKILRFFGGIKAEQKSELSKIIEDAKSLINSGQKTDSEASYKIGEEHPYFSVITSEDKKIAAIRAQLNKAKRRLESIKKKTEDPFKAARIQENIDNLEKSIDVNDFESASIRFIEQAEEEFKVYGARDPKSPFKSLLQKFEEGEDIEAWQVESLQNFINTYKEILGIIINSQKRGDEIRILAEDMLTKVRSLEGHAQDMDTQVGSNFFDEKLNRNDRGEAIIDGYTGEEATQDDLGHMSWIRRNILGSLSNTSSNTVRLISKFLKDLKFQVRNYTFEVKEEISKLQREAVQAGLNTDDLFEVGRNGERTGNIISEYNIGDYYEDRRKVFTEVAKEFGFEDYSEMKADGITDKIRERIKEKIKEFEDNNTVTKTIKEEVKKSDNKIEIVEKTVKIPIEKYRNPKFNKVIKTPQAKRYYNYLVNKKKEENRKIFRGSTGVGADYRIPAIKGDLMDKIKMKGDKNIVMAIKEHIYYGFNPDKDDTSFGDLESLEVGDKSVPIFFTGKLENNRDLTWDISGAYIAYSEMAENFRVMNEISAPLSSFMRSVSNNRKTKIDKRGNVVTSSRTLGQEGEYKELQSLIDAVVYGIEDQYKSSAKTAKRAKKVAGYIRYMNLVFNFTTSAAGQVKAGIDLLIEQTTKLYITPESRRWARVQVFKELPNIMAQAGKNSIDSKIHRAMELFGDSEDFHNHIRKMHRSRGKKLIMDSNIAFLDYRMGAYVLNAQVIAGVLDNMRLHNGKFKTYDEFSKEFESTKEANKKWKELRKDSLWNSLDKNLKPVKNKEFITNETLARVKHVSTHLIDTIEGRISKEDKSSFARSVVGILLLIHKGWLMKGLDNRLKRAGTTGEKVKLFGLINLSESIPVTNLETGVEDIGSYAALKNWLFKAVKEANTSLIPKMGKAWKNLSKAEKRGVIRTLMDVSFAVSISIIAATINGLASQDDDDDYEMQFLSLLSNRIFMEHTSLMNPQEFISLIEKPAVGVNHLKDLLSIANMFANGTYDKEIDRGAYKGWQKWEKMLMRRIPGKNLYELQYPEEKNKFYKSIITTPIYTRVYDSYDTDQ